jgi:ADP-heptose:LPS heptosyltransferase
MTGTGDFAAVRRLLIFRTGSIGDTVVALPSFHLLRRAFPNAERRVLTNFPINSAAAPLQSVLGEAGFVHGYIPYPLAIRNPRRLLALRREISGWAPDCGVYLRERRGTLPVRRDIAFLRLCGIPRVLGAGMAPDLARHHGPDRDGKWEAEASRLARCLAPIGDARIEDPASWDMLPSAAEMAAAARLLAGWPGRRRFAVFASGAKIAVKEWGDDKWRRVLDGLTADAPDLGLVLVGAASDAARSASMAAGWRGPMLNLCGRCDPRASALVIRDALLLLCHDSGPMHLAASVGTPAVAVFSTHSQPGIWFPHGRQHRVFYPGLAWSGGDPPVRRPAAGEYNITQLPADQVLDAARSILAARTGAASRTAG